MKKLTAIGMWVLVGFLAGAVGFAGGFLGYRPYKIPVTSAAMNDDQAVVTLDGESRDDGLYFTGDASALSFEDSSEGEIIIPVEGDELLQITCKDGMRYRVTGDLQGAEARHVLMYIVNQLSKFYTRNPLDPEASDDPCAGFPETMERYLTTKENQ